jgi:anti-sigma factor RsiW
MMQQPSDDVLVAYLDGELDETRSAEISAAIEHDPMLRARLTSLTETTALIREAFEPVLREPVPEHLFAATHVKASGNVVAFPAKTVLSVMTASAGGWWLGTAVAASFACLVFGASVGYIANDKAGAEQVSSHQLDNFAGYHDLLVSRAGASELSSLDFTDTKPNLPSDVALPDLHAWGLNFVEGRRIIAEGKPAFQFSYNTDNKELGPVTLFVTNSSETDAEPTFETRGNVNMLYWRHRGHGYYIVSAANKGWMWGLKNDIAYQLKAL